MKIGIVGYGKMGKEIEQVAIERGHEISLIVDKNDNAKLKSVNNSEVDVIIEFTLAQSAVANYNTCFDKNIPVVSGTTGISPANFLELKKRVETENKTFFWSSNFSVGVNITFKINEMLAKIMNPHTEYNVKMEEIHHIHKLDAPSGTAITLAEGLIKNIDRKKYWVNSTQKNDTEIEIDSVRQGDVPGTHIVEYVSDIDKISLKHEAFGRKGFALGSVLASEYIYGKTGLFSMDDLLK